MKATIAEINDRIIFNARAIAEAGNRLAALEASSENLFGETESLEQQRAAATLTIRRYAEALVKLTSGAEIESAIL